MIDSTKCPACGHMKHYGSPVCGVEVGGVINGEGEQEPVRCPCNDATAKKASKGKARFDLIPPFAMLKLAEVYEYGARKYMEDSWRTVPNALKEYEAAGQRHYNAWKRGETHDPESGKLHLAHFLWNVVAMLELDPKSFEEPKP